MKQIIKHITGIVGAFILAGNFVSCDRYDYPDRFRATDGVPTISYVRYADKDVFMMYSSSRPSWTRSFAS